VRRAWLAAALLAALLPGAAGAHGRSTSTSSWEIDGATPASARISVRVAWADLQRVLPELGGLTPDALGRRRDLAERVDAYLAERYRLRVDGITCPARPPIEPLPTPDPTHLGRRWRARCPRPGQLSIRADAFTEAVPSHLHLARVRVAEAPPVERVFVLAAPELPLDTSRAAAPPPSSVGEFVRLGIEHIATGYDHLAFLLALLLVGVSVGEVATIVTGFTVAHSLTLALGVLGMVRPGASAVEALIGLSIAVVALENAALTVSARVRRGIVACLAALFAVSIAGALAGRVGVPALALAGVGLFSLCYFGLLRHVARPFRMRWLLAFVFGLVHGFGFAGILAQMELPRERLANALFGFNAGVEAGQLALVALAWPALRLALRGTAARRRLVVQVGSAGVLAAGLFWFVSRAVV